jgi:hypothetical protein
MEATILEARIRADYAEASCERGDVAALVRARELVGAARALGERQAQQDVLATCARVDARLAGTVQSPPAITAASARPAGALAVTCEGEYWTVSGLGEVCRLKDSRGMQMLAKLLAEPGREIHALELAGADTVDAGDAGEVIDRDARVAYQSRLRELREELEQAEDWNDAARRERIAEEIEALTAELSNAIGLGGRERRSGGAAERARQNVRRRLADAMKRIEEASPAIGRHLSIAVRTGTTCSYDPQR